MLEWNETVYYKILELYETLNFLFYNLMRVREFEYITTFRDRLIRFRFDFVTLLITIARLHL